MIGAHAMSKVRNGSLKFQVPNGGIAEGISCHVPAVHTQSASRMNNMRLHFFVFVFVLRLAFSKQKYCVKNGNKAVSVKIFDIC